MHLRKKYSCKREMLWRRRGSGKEARYHPYSVITRKAGMLKLGGKWDASLDLWTSNLRWAESSPDCGEDLAEALLETGWLWFKKGDYQKSLELYGRGETCCRETGDESRLNGFWAAMGTAHLNRGEYQQCQEYYQKSLESSRRRGNQEELARSLNNLAMLHWDQGLYQECLKLYRQTMGIYRESGNEVKLAQLTGNMALAYWGIYDFASAKELLKEGITLARKTGDMQTYAMSLGNLAGMLIQEGELAEAAGMVETRLGFAARFGDNKNRCIALGQMAQICFMKGDFGKAEEGYLLALETAEKLNLKYYQGYYLTMLVENAWAVQNKEKAESYLDRAGELAGKINVGELKFNVRKLGARLAGSDRGAAVLKAMLKEGGWDQAQQADLHYELFMLEGDPLQRKETLGLYWEIVQKAPLYEYKKRISELER